MSELDPKWPELRQLILERDGHKCVRCGAAHDLHVHHIHPRYFGGQDQPANLITVCRACHTGYHIDQQIRLGRRVLEDLAFQLKRLLKSVGVLSGQPLVYGPLLRMLTGTSEFRTGQREIVEAILAGESVIVVRPTGSGKSVCFQLPALLREKQTLVISPLKALMRDQVQRLWRQLVPATFINSDLTTAEREGRLRWIQKNLTKLVYVAPERFNPAMSNAADELSRMPVGLMVVDEAHCIDKWGRSFRPDYARLGEIRMRLGNPPIAAFTATATQRVRDEIKRSLRVPHARTFVHGFDRPNVALALLPVSKKLKEAEAKTKAIIEILSARANNKKAKTLIFVPTKSIGAELLDALRGNGIDCELFHSGIDGLDRASIQNRFSGSEEPALDTVICTPAFGMGIDISNVRLVLHWCMPKSVDDYFQEVGRAGRDGGPSLAVLLRQHKDEAVVDFMIEKSIESAQINPQDKTAALRVERSELSVMVSYAEPDSWLRKKHPCLRGFILNYFGEKYEPPSSLRRWIRRHLLLWTNRYCCSSCDALTGPALLKAVRKVTA